MNITVALLREFDQPLSIEEREAPELREGEVLVRLTASGICGSDLHIWRGRDPRIQPPLVLGHEGVGEIEAIQGEKRDILGRPLKPGDAVIWDRGVTCGQCYFCAVKKQPALCPNRRVYGISQDGCFASHLSLLPDTKILKLEGKFDPALLAPAACSGATVAHAIELCQIAPGDSIVVQGPGPLGIFAVAFAHQQGAKQIMVFGTERSRRRLELCQEFGADQLITTDDTTPQDRIESVRSQTEGRGADAVIDCSGSVSATVEGIRMTAPGGIYALPGVAAPLGQVPLRIYEDVARKNLRIQGVWVSDTSHLYQAVQLVLSGRYPFEKLITHRLPLTEATQALELLESRRAIKAVLIP